MRAARITLVAAGFAIGLALAGCTSPPRHAAVPAPRPLGADYPSPAPTESPPTSREAPLSPEPTGTLTLNQALEQALLRNPELSAISYGVRAAGADIRQARLLPNPKLALEVEEYDRNGEGSTPAEGTLAVEQKFLMGGKRRWRTQVAEAKGELAGWTYEGKRLDVFTATTQRFVGVIVAQRRLDLARSMVGLAEETSRAANERVKAGKEPRLQASKAEAALEVARMSVIDAENELDVSRRTLAAMWGSETTSFEQAQGDLDAVLDTVPDLDTLRALLDRNPDLARWDAELRLRRAALASAKAGRVPDVSAAVGYQQFNEDDTDSFAFGIGVPLPLFDRNQGNVAAAEHRLDQAEAQFRAVETTLSAELAASHAGLVSVHNRVRTLRSKVVPSMEDAYEAAHEGYRQGKFGFLDMLDAQRGLFTARASLLDALANYHTALTNIQRLTGTSIQELTGLTREEQR